MVSFFFAPFVNLNWLQILSIHKHCAILSLMLVPHPSLHAIDSRNKMHFEQKIVHVNKNIPEVPALTFCLRCSLNIPGSVIRTATPERRRTK